MSPLLGIKPYQPNHLTQYCAKKECVGSKLSCPVTLIRTELRQPSFVLGELLSVYRYDLTEFKAENMKTKLIFSKKLCLYLLVRAAVSRFELPWQIFAKSDSCPFSCRKIYALPEKRCFQFFLGVLTSQ